MKPLITLTFGAMLFGAVATAQEPIVVQRPAASSSFALMTNEPFSWSGFYIGGNLGGLLTHSDFRGPLQDDSSAVTVDAADQLYENIPVFTGVETGSNTFFVPRHSGTDGAPIGGGQIGYQHQFGHIVVGVEGSFDRTATSASSLFRGTESTSFFGFNEREQDFTADTTLTAIRHVETNWNGAAIGKIGYAHGPFLFYALGGATWTDVNVWAHDTAATSFFENNIKYTPDIILQPPQAVFIGSITNTNIARDEEVRAGWTAGFGADIAISNLVTLGLQYRHNDYGSHTVHFASQEPIFPGSTRVDVESDQVTLRFNVMLSHFFGQQNYAGTTASDENISVADTTAADGKDKWSGKDKNVAVKQEEPFSWTGIYIGGNVGGYWVDYDFDSFLTDVDLVTQFEQGDFAGRPEAPAQGGGPSSLIFFTPGFDGNGGGGSDSSIIGGGQLGYNYQFGHFVAGVEGDFGGTSTSSSTRFTSTQIANFIDDSPFSADTTLLTTRQASTNWTASGRARLGWAQGRLLLYATGGGVWTDVRTRAIDTASTDFFVGPVGFEFIGNVTTKNVSNDDSVEMGWTAGGGAEWAPNDIVSFGLEYRHNDVGDHTYKYGMHGFSGIFPGSTGINLDSDQVTFRVNILLGHIHGP